ncbi:hypothetical protein Btru_049493 [Bulinus truncatus]|nr:hypothetical protein Btru_049493 [Bulinus truncatus]
MNDMFVKILQDLGKIHLTLQFEGLFRFREISLHLTLQFEGLFRFREVSLHLTLQFEGLFRFREISLHLTLQFEGLFRFREVSLHLTLQFEGLFRFREVSLHLTLQFEGLFRFREISLHLTLQFEGLFRFREISLHLTLQFEGLFSVLTTERTLQSADGKICSFLFTEKLGSISLESKGGQHDICIWHINVDSAISIDFYIRSHQIMTSSKTDDIFVYSHPPGRTDSDKPLVVWNPRHVGLVKSFEGSQFWLTARSAPDVVVDYVAKITNNVNICSNTTGVDLRLGKIQFRNSTVGSKAQLTCNQGFVLTKGTGQLECLVIGGQLLWSGDGSVCESECRHPRPVQHGSHRLQFRGGLRTLDKGFPRDSQTRSTVRYACDNSHQLIGDRVSHCGPDSKGVPTWSAPAPVCQLRDCSVVYSLTSRTGAIVSPKSSDGRLLGGSLNCTWEIQSRDREARVKVLYADLPLRDDDDDVTILEVSDAELRPLLRLAGQSRGVQTVTGSSSKIKVTYLGPRQDTATHRGFLIEYALSPSSGRSRRAADNTANISGDPSVSGTVVQPVSGTVVQSVSVTVDPSSSSFEAIILTDDSSIQATATSPIHTNAAQITTLASSSVDVTDDSVPQTGSSQQSTLYEVVNSADVSGHNTTSFLATAETTDSTNPLGIDASQPYDSTPSSQADDLNSTSGAALNGVTTDVMNSSSDADIVSGSSASTPTATDSVTSSAQVDDSNDDWKIAVGVIMTLLGLGLLALAGYIFYRKKYPVRMIIGREFAKFSNPAYNRSKHAVNLVRDDADDYFVIRSSDSVNPDELNPVNHNIHYDNPAFVSEEDEEEADLKFVQKRPWLFTKYSDSGNFTSRPLSEITLSSSAEFQGNGAKVDSIDSIDAEIDAILGQQQQTPRIKPKRKKLAKTRSQSSSIDTVSGTPSLSGSVDLQEEQSVTPDDDACRSHETSTVTSSQESEKSETNKESDYMKLSKIIFEQPTFEEVCAEVRSRSRSLSLDRNVPEVRLRSYSVDPFKSARKLSLRGDESDTVDRAETIYENILIRNMNLEMLGKSTTSMSSIISESSIIDESMLEGLPETARERCLSLTSQNSNRHLVTDLDDVSVGANSHKSDVIADVTPSAEYVGIAARSGSPVEPESSHEPPNAVAHGEDSSEMPTSLDYADWQSSTANNEHRTTYENVNVEDERLVSLETEQRAGEEFQPDVNNQNGLKIGGDSNIPSAESGIFGETKGKRREVRFESLKGEDEDDEEDSVKLSSTRTLSISSQASSLSVSSAHTETSESSNDSNDLRSYSFNNKNSVDDEHEINRPIDREEVTSEDEPVVSYEDGNSPPSRHVTPSPTPLPDLPQPPSPVLHHSSTDDISSRFLISSDDKPWQSTLSSHLVASTEISESSSDTSDTENRFRKISQVRKIERQERLSSDDDEDDTKLTLGDIAQILDDVSDIDDDVIASGAITISEPSDRTVAAADQNTFILNDASIDDDIEV